MYIIWAMRLALCMDFIEQIIEQHRAEIQAYIRRSSDDTPEAPANFSSVRDRMRLSFWVSNVPD